MSFVTKMLDAIGIETDVGYDDGYEGGPSDYGLTAPISVSRETNRRTEKRGKESKVVNIHATSQIKLVIMRPESFEEAQEIADHLKANKQVAINLEDVDKAVAKRIIDFLSGTVYALDGNIQKVGTGIFFIAPHNVGIMGDVRDELTKKMNLPWM